MKRVALQRLLRLAAALVFAGCTLLYNGLWMVAARWSPPLPPVELGYDADYLPAEHAQFIRNVLKNSPAQAAGMRKGDRIVAIDGARLADENYQPNLWRQHRPGDTVELTLARPGVPEPLRVTGVFRLRASLAKQLPWTEYLANQYRGSFPVPFVLIGLVVLFLRIGDPMAWLLALSFAGWAAAPGGQENIRAIGPGFARFALPYRAILAGLLPALFYAFGALFPIRSPLDRRAPWLKWVAAALGICFAIPGWRTGNPAPPAALAAAVGPTAANALVLGQNYFFLALGVIAFASNYVRPLETDARRRLRVLFWGVVVGVGPVVVIQAAKDMARVNLPEWVTTAEITVLFLFPLSFAYAVVKHQVLDIPVLLRRSARYLLVQRGFTFLLLAVSIGLTLAFAWQAAPRLDVWTGSSRTSAIILGALFGTGLVWTGAEFHRRVSGRIDRAFFRKSYDARVLLEELAEQSGAAVDRVQLAELLQKHLVAALHPASLGIYLRNGSSDLTLYAGNGAKPAADLSVPMPARNGSATGMLVLGPRLSEEPYSGEDRRLISAVARQAGTALENIRLAEEIAERIENDRRTAREMEIARDVQSRLLPQSVPRLETLECAAKCVQARLVGGDYFDFLHGGAGRLVMLLADVSGKGVHAALLMANLQAHMRSQIGMGSGDPAALLRNVNRLLWESTSAHHYATMFLGIYDDRSRRLTYVNCGHNPPVLMASDGAVRRLEATATVLGLFEQWDGEAATVDLRPGDLLAVFSDGISEAARGEEEFGEERLIEQLRNRRARAPREIVRAILRDVQDFSAGTQSDDLTLLVARSLPQDLPGL